MKKVFFLLLLSLTCATYEAWGYVVVSCQKESDGKILWTRNYHPGVPSSSSQVQTLLEDCLNLSSNRLEVLKGRLFSLDEEKPLFEIGDGTTVILDRIPDTAVCYQPLKVAVVDGDYLDPSKITPRKDLQISWLSFEGDANLRKLSQTKDLLTVLSDCLSLSDLQLVSDR